MNLFEMSGLELMQAWSRARSPIPPWRTPFPCATEAARGHVTFACEPTSGTSSG
jgi:hypothetical protein